MLILYKDQGSNYQKKKKKNTKLYLIYSNNIKFNFFL